MVTFDPQTVVFFGILAAAGALLGGGVAHWRRGRSMVLTGAVIGMVALPVLGYGAIIYAGVLIALSVIGGLVAVGLGFLAG
jgi:CHASE2 domain-containing sensor protein